MSELNKGLLNSLSDNIDSYVYNPDDVIVQKESRVAGMYIIATGEVQVIRFGGETTSLRTKQYFGLASLVKSYSSSTTYIARSFCEILFLKGTIFRHVSKSYMTKPEFDAFVKKNLRSYYEQEKETRKISDTEALAERKSSRQMDFIMKTIQNANFPDSEVRLMWDSILFIGLVFYFTSIPLLLAVMLRDNFLESTLVILCFGFLTDALFIVDFLLQCAIFGYWQDGVVCLDRSKVWKHFWTQNPPLLIFLEVFPLDLALGLSCSMEFYCIFRLLKLLHSRRLSYFAEKFLQTFVSYTGIGVSFEMSRFIALYFMLFQICHWAGCTWRLVADVGTQVFHYEVTWLSVDKHALDYKSMAVVEYARSLYWAASALSSIGYPDILPRNHVEVAVIIVIIFFGYFMFNTCLGAIGNLFSSFNREKREFTMKVERIRQVLKHNKIPSSIETRVINYFDHLWARYNGVNEEELLNDLPPTLRGAVVRFVIGPLLTSIPFFAHCSEPMENLLLSMVESRCFLDGDPLMVAGELGKEMFVIEVGFHTTIYLTFYIYSKHYCVVDWHSNSHLEGQERNFCYPWPWKLCWRELLIGSVGTHSVCVCYRICRYVCYLQ
ncbi:cyclic nucleotide-binding domain-containing protein [archaeon]|nr:MAG: cyclic nucleotide-binding domain-containing protein [archaeon]